MVFEFILEKNGIDPKADLTIDQSIDFGSTAAAFSGGQGDFTVEFQNVLQKVKCLLLENQIIFPCVLIIVALYNRCQRLKIRLCKLRRYHFGCRESPFALPVMLSSAAQTINELVQGRKNRCFDMTRRVITVHFVAGNAYGSEE